MFSWVVPLFPGYTSNNVSSILDHLFGMKRSFFPVMPCTTRRVDLSTKTLMINQVRVPFVFGFGSLVFGNVSRWRPLRSATRIKDQRPKARNQMPAYCTFRDHKKFKRLSILRHFNSPTKLFADVSCHRFSSFGFAVRQNVRRGAAFLIPSNQFRISCQSACAEKPPIFSIRHRTGIHWPRIFTQASI